MANVVIIPARGGSKRIPNKNIRFFLGKPIIAYSIEAARLTGLFDRIIVSTDSDQIAQVAKQHGAEVPFLRPAELADDFTATGTVIFHALQWLFDNNSPADYVCCLYATAPLIRPIDIIRGYELLRERKAISALSVTTFPYPIFRAVKLNNDGKLEMIWPEYRKSRSQDLPVTYHDAGQFYWAGAEQFMEEHTFLTEDAVPVILPRYIVQDIDTLEDWEMAEKMYRIHHEI